MADFKIGRSPSSIGNAEPAALARDRVAITKDSVLQWKLEGRVFYAQQGNAGTKLDFNETTYVVAQPEFALCVPQGILCIPLAMNITLEDIEGDENHIIWSTTTNDIKATTSTALIPVNYRRDNLYAPACRAYSLVTGAATTAAGLVEVHRWYHPKASALVTDGADLHHHRWTIKDLDMPLLLGPATLQCHIYGATELEGYGEYTWVELDANELGL